MPINGITAKPASSPDVSNDAFFDSVDEMVGQLADGFTSWARDELRTVLVALDGVGGDPAGLHDVSKQLFTTMHDLKGQAGTFGFDLLSEIGGSLCEHLRDMTEPPPPKQAEIMRLHIMAAMFVLDRNLTGNDRQIWDQFRTKRDALIAAADLPENDSAT
tara:strand:- start:576 stop:1055 length:480 start_codon:yes stop_codon:yes gene_type:complete